MTEAERAQSRPKRSEGEGQGRSEDERSTEGLKKKARAEPNNDARAERATERRSVARARLGARMRAHAEPEGASLRATPKRKK